MRALWLARQPSQPTELIEELTATGVPRDLAGLLAHRGFSTASQAAAFLTPAVANLHDSALLKGMPEALDLLVGARERREAVAVIGDYDVDGLTATALLLGVFRAVGMTAHGILPNRHAGGYGPQPQHMERAEALGCRLVVTADCGIRAYEALAEAQRRGLAVIVTDHHLPGGRPVAAAAVINPRQEGCPYPFKELAGVGLALKLAAALLQRVGRPVPWISLFRIACLGTIADAAELVGENRVFAKLGLAALAATPSAGLRALLAEADVGAPVTAHDVGFRLGPRLNAAGRLGAADPALELLMTRDALRARELAAQLGQWNTERRGLERRVVDDCAAKYAGRTLPPILVAWSAEWNRGVVGIAAGRLARQFHRPAILFAVGAGSERIAGDEAGDGIDGAAGVAVGSGRSVAGVDLHRFLSPWEGQLERFGGHAQAVGLTARSANLARLAAEWESGAAAWAPESFAPTLTYDQEAKLSAITPELLQRLARLAPFGNGNPEPVWRFGPCRRLGGGRSFGNGHLSFVACEGGSLLSQDVTAASTGAADSGNRSAGAAGVEVVAWQWAERADPSNLFDSDFEMLAVAEHDPYRNRPRLRLVDIRPASQRASSDSVGLS